MSQHWVFESISSVVIGQDGAAPAPGPITTVGLGGESAAITPGGTTGGGAPATQGGGGSSLLIFLPLILVFGLMIFMQSRASKKEAKRRAEMFSSMKKHDKVQTIGGVIGTIVDVQENEIVLRVEEGRIRFAKSAIQQVIKEGKADSVAEGKPDSKTTANV